MSITVLDADFCDYWPAFSPDGKRSVFERKRSFLTRGCRSALLWVLIVTVCSWAVAAPGAASTSAPRLIDERDRVVQSNSVHPMALSKYEVARAKADLPMEQMILSLSLRPGAWESLERLLADQHDPRSPLYHQWLTPEQFGARFGLQDKDLETVETWLTDQGFTIDEVAKGRGWINFSGTASQVERAFSTEIHAYKVEGKIRHANAVEISIPRGLTDLVKGVVTLHDFPRQTYHTFNRKVSADELNEKYTTSDGSHFLAPADFATIYNLNSVYAAGINGSGQTIAIAGRTDINLADVQFFRSFFGLPVNDPVFIHNGPAPGNLGGIEESEADLAVQWSGAVARNATIKFVITASTATTNGMDLSAQYIVNNNLGEAMSTSSGQCEIAMDPIQLAFYNLIWAQAASQGITSVVPAGDAGAAGCSRGDDRTGFGLGVNGLCSTPYNVCVGGTQLNDAANPSLYWSNSNNLTTQGSALSYIPELAWNESRTVLGGSNLWSTGGGASATYLKPSWQSMIGVPADGRRDVPDVSLSAAGHDGYLVVQGHTTGTTGLTTVRGTAAASSSFAGLMALIVQKTGTRQGNANTVFYPMAASQFARTLPMVFHDVTSGNNSVPGVTGFSCTLGYDRVTGLGSVDGELLINNWAGLQIPFQIQGTVNTSATPSAVSLNGTTYVFYKGANTDTGIYMTTSSGSIDPGNWTNAKHLPLAITTNNAPSAVVVGTTIYVAYMGTDAAIWVARSLDSAATWSLAKFPAAVSTSTGPNAYNFGGTFYVFYKGPGSDQRMYVSPLPGNTVWTPLAP
jgi:pseudomonalisin